MSAPPSPPQGLPARRGHLDSGVPRDDAAAAVAARRRGRGRQDRARQDAGAATGGELIRLQCYEGIDVAQAVYDWDYARQLLHLRATEATGESTSTTADELESRAVRRAVPDQARVAALDRARRGPAAGAADRRGRPRRRRVRGLPPRGAVRLPGHDPRGRRVQCRAATAGGAHIEPHPRRPRRTQAAVPLPLGRAPRIRPRGGDRQTARARASTPGSPGRWPARSKRCAD